MNFDYTQEDFEFIRKKVSFYSGIHLPDEKYYLVYSRLLKRLRALGLSSFSEYCIYLESNPDSENTNLINEITTNVTHFFRENHQFQFLIDHVVPLCINNKIRIWSAGCSCGQEPYSIAITLLENLDPSVWDIQIFASDLCDDALAQAVSGVYKDEEFKDFDERLIKKYCLKGKYQNTNKIKMKPFVQSLIHFQKLNLIEDWTFHENFDVIFCRNVIIYFSNEVKHELILKFSQYLNRPGYLLLGHSENIFNLQNIFKSLGQSNYELR